MSTRSFSLLEIVIVAVIVLALTVLLGAMIQTSTYVNRDVWTHNEVADLATRLADEAQSFLILAVDNPINVPPAPVGTIPNLIGTQTVHPFRSTPRSDANNASFVPPADLDFETAGSQGPGTAAGANFLLRPSFTFRMRYGFDAAGNPEEGAAMSARQQIQYGMVRMRWIPDPTPRRYAAGLNPGEVTEAALGRDINGDNVVSAGATQRYLVGHLVVEFLNSNGTPSANRLEIGRESPTRVLWNAPAPNAPNPLLRPIFGQAPVDNNFDSDTSDANEVSADWAAFHRHLPTVACVPTCQNEQAIQLNLTVMHDPFPGQAGRPEVAIFRLQRAVAFR